MKCSSVPVLALCAVCACGQAQSIDEGLSTYWSLDGSSNDILSGSSGSVTGSIDWQVGRYGMCASFGSNSYIATAWAPSVPAGNSFSFALWVKHDLAPNPNANDATYVLGLERSNHQEISLSLNPWSERMNVFFRDDNWVSLAAGVPWSMTSDDQWHHVVGVLDGDAAQVRMYLDGVMVGVASGALGNINVDASRSMSIAADNNSTFGFRGPFAGTIDDLRFYDRALSASDVRLLCPPACRADFNADGLIDFFDVQAFLQTFSAGCP